MKGNFPMYFEDHKLLTGKKMIDMHFYFLYNVISRPQFFSRPSSNVFSYTMFSPYTFPMGESKGGMGPNSGQRDVRKVREITRKKILPEDKGTQEKDPFALCFLSALDSSVAAQ